MEMPLQHQIMGYDRVTSMFSPDGRLLQVEYAEKMVRRGFASIGIVCQDGVLIVANKRPFDKLSLPENVKILEVDSHIAATGAGMLSDARILIDRAQLQAQQHRVTYDESVDVESVVKEIADLKQMTTQFGGARPFGVEVIITGVNTDNEKKLYVTDVAGNYFAYKATAVGENEDKIKEELRNMYKDDLKIEDGIKMCLEILKKLLGKSFDIRRVDCAYITTKDKQFTRLESEKLKRYVK